MIAPSRDGARTGAVSHRIAKVTEFGDGIVSAFSSLVAAQVIAAMLGYLFWVAIARSMPARDIAVAHAAVSIMALLGVLGTIGYGTLLLGELPIQPAPDRRSMLRNGLVLVTLVAALIATLWCLVAPRLGATFASAVRTPGSALLLVVGITATATGVVLDQASIALGRPALQVARNLIASALKFPLVFLLILAGFRSQGAVLVAWVLPLVLSIAFIWRRTGLLVVGATTERLSQHIRRYLAPALLNHALNMALAASSLFLPLIAAALLSARDYAGFSLAWLVATFVFTPAFMLAVALFATSVDDEAAYRTKARRTLPAGAAVGLLCYAGAALLAKPVMATFGASYVAEGVEILRIVALAVLALVVKDHLFALYRVRRQMGRATTIGVLGLALELTGATIGAEIAGAAGLSVGWLVALYLQAVVMLPKVLPRGRQRPATSAAVDRAPTRYGSAADR